MNLELAGIPVQMDNRYPELETLCRGYETQKAPVICLSVTAGEIEAERRSQPGMFSDGYLETICLYRRLALEMLAHQVFIMHASVIEVDGEGYAFLAASGTGKTTQTRLWLECFGSRARVINGDKPLVRVEPDGGGWKFIAFGTPWCGKEGMGSNASVTIKAIFLLERAKEPYCEPADQEECIDRIFRQLLLPEREEQMEQLLTLADRLIESVPVYVLRCNMTADSVTTAYEAAK